MTDESLNGLGAVLIQEGKLVRFFSKTLTPTGAIYSDIERGLLAVLFACEKPYTYTFGWETHSAHGPQAPTEHFSETNEPGSSQIAEDIVASI